jgi:hypothetical protein
MLSEVYYLVRSPSDGRYLTAHPDESGSSYLLLFREHFDALSYLNTHAGELANRLAVESIPGSQLSNLLKRWGFVGMGIVTDPLIPKIEFLKHGRPSI